MRIFHPASGQDLRWHGEQVHGENEHVVRWAEAAEREGAIMHPPAQWSALIDGYRQPKYGEDGWQYGEPGWGQMDLRELAAVPGVLARHTATQETASPLCGKGTVKSTAPPSFSRSLTATVSRSRWRVILRRTPPWRRRLRIPVGRSSTGLVALSARHTRSHRSRLGTICGVGRQNRKWLADTADVVAGTA